MPLRRILGEARDAALFPRDFYSEKPELETWGAPALRLAFWSFVAGLVDVVFAHLTGHHEAGDFFVDALTLVAFPVLGVGAGFLAALVLHGCWKAVGGRGTLRATWRAAGSVAFAMPFIALAQPLGTFVLLPWLWLYYLLMHAGRGVHHLSRGRAWAVSVVLALVLVAALLAG